MASPAHGAGKNVTYKQKVTHLCNGKTTNYLLQYKVLLLLTEFLIPECHVLICQVISLGEYTGCGMVVYYYGGPEVTTFTPHFFS